VVASPALAAHPRAHRAWVCANTELRPTRSNLSSVRAATRCLVNRERVSRGERALTSSPRLARAAQNHTESMAFGGYFAHVGPGGDTPMTRIRAAGYMFNAHVSIAVGENIAWGTLRLSTPRAIVASWMASPDHRANILDPRFRSTAIGVSAHLPWSLSRGQAGGMYTEDFGSIPAR
jgi:uncharacterized protein YkwD